MNTSYNFIHTLEWTLSTKEQPQESTEATVPGACQLDWAAYRKLPSYSYGTGFLEYEFMEDLDFVYKSVFDNPCPEGDKSVWFVAKGIDYKCSIFLNNKLIARNEGSQTPVEVQLGELLDRDNVLEIEIDRVPLKEGAPKGREQAAEVTKAPVSYGWDWHPRLIPSGIWDEAGLQLRPDSWIDFCDIKYRLSEDYSCADINVECQVSGLGNGCRVKWQLLDENGKLACSASSESFDLHAKLTSPQLWWTHDQGHPHLYKSVTELIDSKGNLLDRHTANVGFRELRLVLNDGAWDMYPGLPISRPPVPIQIRLNGRNIFAKGTNWVNPEIFPGTIGPHRYEELLEKALSANFNLLRCWGGCMANKDYFYHLCDSYGILVWQEFPLSCNRYGDDRHYLDVLCREATSIVRRLMGHPSILLFCGGNELFNSWSGMDDQSLALRMLDSICYSLCPEIPFLATSPLTGMAHGNYLFRDHESGEDVFSWMRRARHTAYCEFGVASLAPAEVLRTIIPEDELFPIRKSPSWIAHHAFGAWDDRDFTWFDEETLNHYFRKPKSLEETVNLSGLLQGEGLRCIYEEARRQKPLCSMALCWMFNEPWPTGANNSIVAYPAIPKACFRKVAEACRPVCASASFDRYQWKGGEELTFRLWMLNDSFNTAFYPKSALVILKAPDGSALEVTGWQIPPMVANTNVEGPEVRFPLPDWPGSDRFTLEILVAGHPEMDSCYTLSYLPQDC